MHNNLSLPDIFIPKRKNNLVMFISIPWNNLLFNNPQISLEWHSLCMNSALEYVLYDENNKRKSL